MAVKKTKKSSQNSSFGKEKQTTAEILSRLASSTGLKKRQIEEIFSLLFDMMVAHTRKGGSGEFIIPIIGIKIRRTIRKARKARMLDSPLLGERYSVKAKPAQPKLKIIYSKKLKKAIGQI